MPLDRQQQMNYAALERQRDASLDAGERYRATLARLGRIPAAVFHGLLREEEWRDICRITAAVHAGERTIEAAARRAGLTGRRLNRARQSALRLGLLRAEYTYEGQSRRSDQLAADLGRSEELERTAAHCSALERAGAHCSALERTPAHASEAQNNPAHACAPARASIDYDSIDRSIESIREKSEEDWRVIRTAVGEVINDERAGRSKAADVRDLIICWLIINECLAEDLLPGRWEEIARYAIGRPNTFASVNRCVRNEVESAGHDWHRLHAQLRRLIPGWMLKRREDLAHHG